MKFVSLMSSIFAISLAACTPSHDKSAKDEQYLHQQEEKQGYPVLIAVPQSADYGLPFCEKQYCLDVEIFGLKSQDEWFNHYVDQQIANLIRLQLQLEQKLSLQKAVNEFVRLSDEWQEEKKNQPWSVLIQTRVATQHHEITLLQIQTEYTLGDLEVPEKIYYFVVDRKKQEGIKLYDVIKDNMREEFGSFLQTEYQKWLETQPNKDKFTEKIYWANQDWFFDDQGVAVYYRSADLSTTTTDDNLTIYLPKAQTKKWLKINYFDQLGL